MRAVVLAAAAAVVVYLSGAGSDAAPGDAAGAARAAAAANAARTATWIFFRDHGAEALTEARRAHALHTAAERLAPRALARRAKAIRELDARRNSAVPSALTQGPAPAPLDDADLDPNPTYVKAVLDAGARLRTSSRWLNAVSVEASPSALDEIRAYPFVRETAPVAIAVRDRAGESPGADAADDFEAGPAFRQLDLLHIGEAHAMGDHGEGVLICVLDSGFELEHEVFRQLDVRATRDFLNGDEDVSFDPRTDVPGQSSHGTQVLSVLAGYAPGRLIGPAYRAAFLLGKTERSGSEQPVEEDYWCAGVEWAEEMGADIVSSSLSYPLFYRWRDMDGRTAPASRAANLALERGLLIVNSVGNAGPGEGRLGAPADAPGAISVGAVDAGGRLASFSTVGPTWDRRVKPDLCAMGVAVVTARPLSGTRYNRASGTSFSTPLVAGCAALILSAHPDWGPEAVRDALTMTADRADRPDNGYGWGLPDARAAILYPLIEGRVLDADTREPIAGARITWEPGGAVDSAFAAPGDSPPRGEASSDSTGSYLVANLPPGAYLLRASAAGYESAVTEPLEVPPNLGEVNISLRLRNR
jgi:subtilisin family serine protease